MKTGVYIGRFQPFHEGHKRCVEHILKTNDRCIIFVRDTEKTEKNPLELSKRLAMIRSALNGDERVMVQTLPDPSAELSVYIGRDVGYELIQLDTETEAISATDLRRKLYSDAGKAFDPSAPKRVR
ncbi:MAG: adenylyltransferase/cytidyltransferase family protein [Patescibacteria group bacterium]